MPMRVLVIEKLPCCVSGYQLRHAPHPAGFSTWVTPKAHNHNVVGSNTRFAKRTKVGLAPTFVKAKPKKQVLEPAALLAMLAQAEFLAVCFTDEKKTRVS